jgi:hypothetical protein
MSINILWGIIQALLLIAKLIIQIVVCKDDTTNVSVYDLLLGGKSYNLSIFFPIKCADKINCKACKAGNILLLIFYLNFLLLIFI